MSWPLANLRLPITVEAFNRLLNPIATQKRESVGSSDRSGQGKNPAKGGPIAPRLAAAGSDALSDVPQAISQALAGPPANLTADPGTESPELPAPIVGGEGVGVGQAGGFHLTVKSVQNFDSKGGLSA